MSVMSSKPARYCPGPPRGAIAPDWGSSFNRSAIALQYKRRNALLRKRLCRRGLLFIPRLARTSVAIGTGSTPPARSENEADAMIASLTALVTGTKAHGSE